MPNFYDDIEFDIIKAHTEINSNPELKSKIRNQKNILRRNFDKLLFYFGWYQRLIDSGFYRLWFEEFNDYWVNVLNGRPLRFHDYFFLYSLYRMRYQSVEMRHGADDSEFMAAYHSPHNLYCTFNAHYRYSLAPFRYWLFRKYLKPGDNILEYGCGMAPITTSLINDRKTNFSFTLADIPQFTYHYAKWRLKQFDVKFIDISLDSFPQFDKEFDVIFLQEVFEHLPQPLETVKYLTNNLKKGGYFIFDYVVSDATGVDTIQGLEQRSDVLNFIGENYEIISGEIKFKEHMGRTVVRKK